MSDTTPADTIESVSDESADIAGIPFAALTILS